MPPLVWSRIYFKSKKSLLVVICDYKYDNKNEYINSINSIQNLNCGSNMKPEQNYLLMCLNIILNINDYNLSFRNLKMEYMTNFLDHCYC